MIDAAELKQTMEKLKDVVPTLQPRFDAFVQQADSVKQRADALLQQFEEADVQGDGLFKEIQEAMQALTTTVVTNREALLAAMDTVCAKHPGAAVMLVSADAGEGKVTIVAKVAEPLVKRGLKAGDWVREASAAVGGKGGGRPDSAQGGGTDPSKMVDAIGIARTFASSKLG